MLTRAFWPTVCVSVLLQISFGILYITDPKIQFALLMAVAASFHLAAFSLRLEPKPKWFQASIGVLAGLFILIAQRRLGNIGINEEVVRPMFYYSLVLWISTFILIFLSIPKDGGGLRRIKRAVLQLSMRPTTTQTLVRA